MARQILWRTVQSVGYYPTCNLGNLSGITTWMLAEDRKFSSRRHRTSLLWRKRSPGRHICWHQIPMPSSSTGVTGRVGDGCLSTQWSVFQGRKRELRRASAYTVSLHFVWGRHYLIRQGSSLQTQVWVQTRARSCQNSKILAHRNVQEPIVDCLSWQICVWLKLLHWTREGNVDFFLLPFIFKNLSVTHWNNCIT